jgi:hypothetical protein
LVDAAVGLRPGASAGWTSAILLRLKELSLPTVAG